MAYSKKSTIPSCLRNNEFTINLESRYGLLDHLLSNHCLTGKEVEGLKQSTITVEERNRKLMEYINENNIDQFIQGLLKSKQNHLVNFICNNGIREHPDDDDWPLSESYKLAITTSYSDLVEEMDTTSFVDKLFARECFSDEQMGRIAKGIKQERNRKFLEIMTRKSVGQFKIFLECLKVDHYHLWEKIASACTTSLLSSSSKVGIIQHNKPISGVTVMDNKIFVVGASQSRIHVYDSHSLASLTDVDVPGLKLPRSLAGCSYNKALYISDYELRCIHRVDLTYGLVNNWARRGNHLLQGLSVTAHHTLLVTAWINGIESECGVLEYTSDGQFVREIRFHGIESVQQTIQLSSDQFIVCHGYGGCSLHRVCMINNKGQIIKTYGRQWGEREGQLNGPCSLTIDDSSRHIFISEFGNNRVTMLDTDLNYKAQADTPDDLTRPYRVYFDSSTTRLLVGEAYNGRLLVITPPC